MTHLPGIKARLAIHAHRKVRGLLQGEYASVHVGRSMDLNDLREYVRGDDVRDLDWKASARSGSLLVKRYVATRKHTLMLAVSTGRSMAGVNDRQVPKRDLAVHVAGILGLNATQHGDLVAAVYGDSAEMHARPPSDGEVKLERSLGAIHDAITPDSAPADVVGLLEHVARVVRRRRTILVVICDEYAISEPLADALRRATAQHEVMLVTIGDLDPTRVVAPLADVETGAALPDWMGGDRRLEESYAAMVADDAQRMDSRLARLGIPHEHIADHESALYALHRLLERHRHVRRR